MDDLKHFDAITDVQLERIVGHTNPTLDVRAREILAVRQAERQAHADAQSAARRAELVVLAMQPATLSGEQRFTLWTATVAAIVAAVLAVPPFIDWCKTHFGSESSTAAHGDLPSR